MPPKKRVTDIGIVGSSAPATRRQYRSSRGASTVKQARRTSIDEITDTREGDITSEEKIAIDAFLKNSEIVGHKISKYIDIKYDIIREEKNRVRSLLDVDDGVKINKSRFLNSLALVLREAPNDEGDYGLTDTDRDKIDKLISFDEHRDMELELGYLLRHPDYGIDTVMTLIEDPFLTIDQLPHLNENKRLLRDQMLLANNPMEGVELLKCNSCKQNTYISGLVTTRAWDEMQDTRGSCYNTACRLYKR